MFTSSSSSTDATGARERAPRGAASPRRGRARTRFTDLGVRWQILAASSWGLVAAALVGVIGLTGLGAVASSTGRMYTEHLQPVVQLGQAQNSLDVARREVVRAAQAVPDARQDHVDAGRAQLDAVAEQLAAFRAVGQAEDELDRLDWIDGALVEYRRAYDEVLVPPALAGDVLGVMTGDAGRGDFLALRISSLVGELREAELTESTGAVTDARGTYESKRVLVVAVLVLGLLVTVAAAIAVGAVVARRLTRAQHAAQALADGDLTAESGVTGRDEVGRLGVALDSAAASLRTVLGDVAGSADAVAVAADDLSASASRISASAQETAAQSGVVAGAAGEVSRSVGTVAAGAEQMGASIREIAQNANEAARVAAGAVTEAGRTTTTVAELGESSRAIGDVVKVITSIAEQTNLLALNATIEAARAGEAGRGFAVVAHEVKELAQETARATDDIARRVEAIQGGTSGAVEAIGRISEVIGAINDYQLTIASAVEEQTATTAEMSRSVGEAASGSDRIAVIITSVSDSAGTTTEALDATTRAVADLARRAGDLRASVRSFRY